MKITKENDELVVRIPLTQPSYDALDNLVGQVPNLYGVIAGDEYSISQLIDLGYKGDQQEGMPIVMLNSKEELMDICKEFKLHVIKHCICCKCRKPICGSFTLGEDGYVCMNCEEE